jgi:hypothetical protein
MSVWQMPVATIRTNASSGRGPSSWRRSIRKGPPLIPVRVTAFAVPLLAAITLHASSLEMGLLRAAEFAPFLVFTLPAGVWADLGIRRWLMIAANLVRGLFITVVPLAVFFGWMHLGVLYVVMFVMGSLKVVFENSLVSRGLRVSFRLNQKSHHGPKPRSGKN